MRMRLCLRLSPPVLLQPRRGQGFPQTRPCRQKGLPGDGVVGRRKGSDDHGGNVFRQKI